MSSFSDKSIPILDDQPAQQDHLDFASYSEALTTILRDSATGTPLTIGLFGSWGSGKTTLMRMIKRQIDSSGLSEYRTTWFNAWKYNREESLWRALILNVLEVLRPSVPEVELTDDQRQLINDLERLEVSLYRTVEWQELGKWTLDWAKALQGTAEGAAEVALAFVPGGRPLVDLIKKGAEIVLGKHDKSVLEDFHQEVKDYRREHLQSLEQFERELSRVVKSYVVDQGGRLIIFIDDLDRCLPDKMIDVLEAIKLFLDVPGCIFVLALDQEAALEAIRTRYNQIKTTQYLEKIIQLPFYLPPIASEHMRGFVEKITLQLPDKRCAEVFSVGLSATPRQVKRTLNIFLLLWRLSQSSPGINTIQPVRLAKIVVIQQGYPELFAILRELPGLLRDLELYFFEREQPKNAIDEEGPEITDSSRVVLPKVVEPFVRQSALRRLLTLHAANETGVNFAEITPQEIRPYIFLTHRAVSPVLSSASPAIITEPQRVTIPAGPFIMGSNGAAADHDEKPAHKLQLSEYSIGRYPVLNREYREFVRDAKITPPDYWNGDEYPEGMDDHPVVSIRWHEAVEYCNWLQRKMDKPYRLPTEAEWEKAARGLDERAWPWGNVWDSLKCNSRDSRGDQRTTTPAGQFSPAQGDSFYGLSDMAGNVWEWCSSLYQRYPYDNEDGREDLEVDADRVLRGGSFLDVPHMMRCTARIGRRPHVRHRSIGFRIALGVTTEVTSELLFP